MLHNSPGDQPTNSHNRICTRLSQNYRVNSGEAGDRAIYDFAQSVNAGAIDTESATPLIQDRPEPGALRFEGIERLDAAGPTLDDFLDHWYDTQIRDSEIDELATRQYSLGENGFDDIALAQLRRVYNHLAASRVLCVTRVLTTGADHINEVLHRRAVTAANRAHNRTRFLAGEPVMMMRNDYDRNLFNGDQGIIVRVRRSDGRESPMVVFMRGDRFEAFHLPALGDALELCYATTVHKAQGSEFDTVAVMMPDRDLPLLTRELLYTAVSRARKSVVLVGSVEMIRTAAARKATRYSGLAELLNSKSTGA
jgi:exodeoxyribonuclease V alpha subunit